MDTDDDFSIDSEELASAAKQLNMQLDFDGDGNVEIAEISFVLLCGCIALVVSTLLRELARRHLQREFFSEIKQLSGGWPSGFQTLPNQGYQTSSSPLPPPLPIPDENFNVFRRSHATGKWAVHMPEIDAWGTKKPYPLKKMVEWFRGIVNDKRDASPPNKWTQKPSQWLRPVHERLRCDGDCVFCVGNEKKIEETLHVVPATATKDNGWTLKVISTIKPLVKPVKKLERHQPHNDDEGKETMTPMSTKPITATLVLETKAGVQVTSIGCHEIVIETPHHNETLATMTRERVLNVVQMWKERGCALMRECPTYTKYVHVYKNHGQLAGGSLAHAHSQIVSLGMIPNEMSHYVSLAKIYSEEHGQKCVLCEDISDARMRKQRWVESSEHFHAITPFVQVHPFHLWIVPNACARSAHRGGAGGGVNSGSNDSFFSLDASTLEDFAKILRRTLRRLYNLLDDPDYNLMVRSLPPRETSGGEGQRFHWFVEIIPRIYERDGFQLGTGCTKLSVTPEASAKALREVELSNKLDIRLKK